MAILLPLLVIALFAVAFVLLAGSRVRRERERQAGWAQEARRLGLDHATGDPLGLAGRLNVDEVAETVSGVVDGQRVAALNVTRVRGRDGIGDGPPTRFTWSVGIALDASGPDGGPVVVDRRPEKLALTHSPLPAAQLEGLLRETAARAA